MNNYSDYVIKNGEFIGNFEDMYRNCDDPWEIGDAHSLQYDIILSVIQHHCEEKIINAGILDLGCGKGAFTRRIREVFFTDIYGIDISETAIQNAKQNCKNIHYFSLDINNIVNFSRKFGIIIYSQIMWYILYDLKDTFERIIKLNLVDDGYILINQAFYPPGVQKFGNDFFDSVDGLISYLNINPIMRIDIMSNKLINSTLLLKIEKNLQLN